MPLRRRWLIGAALVVPLYLLPAPCSAKQKHRGGVTQCQQRVADKIRAGYSPSRGVSFDSGVQRNPRGHHAVTISGWGHVRSAKGKKRGFAYSCVYDQRSGALSKVKYTIR